ncbi:Inositol 2-dehydrogenase [metagenome]|uniref:Inositol 2-dehydrogenase n=1 Tax=metagenome TaxID=256318 RepID=A0A2P2CFU9_9ZZZZ
MSSGNAAIANPVRVGLIGAGRIGSSHAEILHRRVPGAELVAVADAMPESARKLAATLGVRADPDPQTLIGDDSIEAVVIAASTPAHADLVVAAAQAGKGVFCEKPMALSLDDATRAVDAAQAAGVVLQVGFNRRFSPDFAAARRAIDDGLVGTPQLMRSLTRDPGLANPAGVAPGTIFLLTLIHDFDTLLWLNPGAEAVEVFVMADALVAPDYKGAGLLDTAIVSIRFDNGALATAEASFSASYGYDVRGEVFGSAGMVSAGDTSRTSMQLLTSAGQSRETVRGDVELFGAAYTAEFVEFVDAVREQRESSVTGRDAKRALAIALACIESARTGAPAKVSS